MTLRQPIADLDAAHKMTLLQSINVILKQIDIHWVS